MGHTIIYNNRTIFMEMPSQNKLLLYSVRVNIRAPTANVNLSVTRIPGITNKIIYAVYARLTIQK